MVDFDLNVGFSRIEINPPMGVNITGYFHKRYAEGILDDVEINTIAIKKDGNAVLLITLDAMETTNAFCDVTRRAIAKATGVNEEGIFIHITHTHTGITFDVPEKMELDIEKEYIAWAIENICLSAKQALDDASPARMGIAFSKAERVAFNRRYLMKDGSVQTNPGVNNPDIVKCIGLLDETVNVIRFERKVGDNIVIANFGNHPDVIGGNLISADWPGFTRRIFERAVENSKCVFFNGALGDINHVNVAPKGGDFNGMFNDFDDVSRGYAHSRHIGNVVAGAILSVFEKTEFIPTKSISYIQRKIAIPSNMPNPEDIPNARYINEMHTSGRDSELPYQGMMLTTVVAEAERMLRLENGPTYFDMMLSGIRLGDVAFIGIPGEPFAGVGLGLKQTKGYKMVCTTSITNGYEGYFPIADSYEEGGYEARSSIYKAGVAETIIKEGKNLLIDLKNERK